MMPQVVRTSRAELDLAEIWTYIARDNPDAADGVAGRRSLNRKAVLSHSPGLRSYPG